MIKQNSLLLILSSEINFLTAELPSRPSKKQICFLKTKFNVCVGVIFINGEISLCYLMPIVIYMLIGAA